MDVSFIFQTVSMLMMVIGTGEWPGILIQRGEIGIDLADDAFRGAHSYYFVLARPRLLVNETSGGFVRMVPAAHGANGGTRGHSLRDPSLATKIEVTGSSWVARESPNR